MSDSGVKGGIGGGRYLPLDAELPEEGEEVKAVEQAVVERVPETTRFKPGTPSRRDLSLQDQMDGLEARVAKSMGELVDGFNRHNESIKEFISAIGQLQGQSGYHEQAMMEYKGAIMRLSAQHDALAAAVAKNWRMFAVAEAVKIKVVTPGMLASEVLPLARQFADFVEVTVEAAEPDPLQRPPGEDTKH